MSHRADLTLLDNQHLPADRNPALVYIGSLSVGSHRTMRAALENIARIFDLPAHQLDWTRLRYQHVQAVRARLAELYAPATANRHMAALRGVLKEAWRLGYLSAEDYQRAIDVKAIPGSRELAGRYVEPEEVEKLLSFAARRKKEIDRRDAAIIAVLYTCGLRRDELISLNVTDYSPRGVRVVGKGNKERFVPVNTQARRIIRAWLDLRSDDNGSLFLPMDKYGNVSTGRLTTQAVYTILKRRCRAAGVNQITPHDFRHTFISNLFDQGTDIATIADLAGHADVEITRRYDRRPERARMDAVERLLIPGQDP